MVKKYSISELDNIDTSVVDEVKSTEEWEFLGIVTARLEDRMTKERIRIKEGDLERSLDMYHQGELFYSFGWEPLSGVTLLDDGLTVSDIEDNEVSVDEWLHSHANKQGHNIGDAWRDFRENYLDRDIHSEEIREIKRT